MQQRGYAQWPSRNARDSEQAWARARRAGETRSWPHDAEHFADNALLGFAERSRGGITELHIGHAIVSRAVFVGMREAVREMKALMTLAEAIGRTT